MNRLEMRVGGPVNSVYPHLFVLPLGRRRDQLSILNPGSIPSVYFAVSITGPHQMLVS